MKRLLRILPLLALAGCSALRGGSFDLGTAIGAGSDLYKAVKLSDAEVQQMASQVAAEEDRTNPVAPAGNKYASRLTRLTVKLKSYDGLKLQYKVYRSPEVNAFALANGNIRVYSGLMDLMSDDELLCVLGHEVGHVKLGHSKEKIRLAYAASAARKGVASSNTIAGVVAASEVGALAEAVVNSQFSQSEETEADEYGLGVIMNSLKRNPHACPAALRKFSTLGDKEHSILDTHPDPEDRAKNLEKKIKSMRAGSSSESKKS